jgi:hypothetical protein
MKKTFLKLGVISLAIVSLAAGVSALAAGVSALTVTKSDSMVTSVKSTVSNSVVNQTAQTSNKAAQINQLPLAQPVLASNVAEGTFGANTGGGNYVFPGGVAAYNFDARGGMTLGTEGLPTSIAFTYADSAPIIRVETGAFKFLRGGQYIFDNNIITTGSVSANGAVAAYNFDAKGGMTLGTEGLPTSIAFTYADSAPTIRVESGAFKFIKGGSYIFDNNVRTVGSIKANDYIAGNGSQGITRKVSVKGSNNQNCSLTFIDGLLTATTCPAN